MSDLFTAVEVAFYPEYLNNWLRFGVPIEHLDLDRRRSIAFFSPGKIFGYVRWWANEYGTRDWRFNIVQTPKPSQSLTPIEGVTPGGEILLFVRGNARVKRALSHIDILEEDGFDPAHVSPAYIRHMHNRIVVGKLPRVYGNAQHEAHLAALKVTS